MCLPLVGDQQLLLGRPKTGVDSGSLLMEVAGQTPSAPTIPLPPILIPTEADLGAQPPLFACVHGPEPLTLGIALGIAARLHR